MTKRNYANTTFRDLTQHPMPSKVEVQAIRATARGEATGPQQQLCFRYILELLGIGTVDDPRWSPTEMAYAASSRSFGTLLSALANTPVAEIEDEHGSDRDHDHRGSDGDDN